MERHVCPVLEDDGSDCSSLATIMVEVGRVFDVPAFLEVCPWHAEVIEPSVVVA